MHIGMKNLAATVAVVTLVAVGCGSSTPEEQTFTPRSGTQTYDSVQQLHDDLAVGGYDCGEITLDSISTFAAQAGRCTLFDREVVLSIFSATTDRDAQMNAATPLLRDAGLEFGYLIGANWIVNCGAEDNCAELKTVMGGKIDSGEERSPAPAPIATQPTPEPDPIPTYVPEPAYEPEPYVPPVAPTAVPTNPYPESRTSNGAPTGQGGGVFIGCPSPLEYQAGTGTYQLDDGSTYFDWAPECL